jgi:hypothetical protein
MPTWHHASLATLMAWQHVNYRYKNPMDQERNVAFPTCILHFGAVHSRTKFIKDSLHDRVFSEPNQINQIMLFTLHINDLKIYLVEKIFLIII